MVPADTNLDRKGRFVYTISEGLIASLIPAAAARTDGGGERKERRKKRVGKLFNGA